MLVSRTRIRVGSEYLYTSLLFQFALGEGIKWPASTGMTVDKKISNT